MSSKKVSKIQPKKAEKKTRPATSKTKVKK
jgi:hypothetical protein